jgi:hypothetical protein
LINIGISDVDITLKELFDRLNNEPWGWSVSPILNTIGGSGLFPTVAFFLLKEHKAILGLGDRNESSIFALPDLDLSSTEATKLSVNMMQLTAFEKEADGVAIIGVGYKDDDAEEYTAYCRIEMPNKHYLSKTDSNIKNNKLIFNLSNLFNFTEYDNLNLDLSYSRILPNNYIEIHPEI